MLKTNSKKATENLKKWLVEHFDIDAVCDEDKTESEKFEDIAKMIYKSFCRCVWSGKNDYQWFNGSRIRAWSYWLGGLPSAINSADYYYTRRAVDVLGEILEETETEKARFSEADAETVMDTLLYRLITKTANV